MQPAPFCLNHQVVSWQTGKAPGTDCLPVLLLQLGEQLHIIRAELCRWGRWEAGRGQRRGGRGSSGLQGSGRGHLASHLTDRVGHRVLHPWESRTQLTSNFVCRHLEVKKEESTLGENISEWKLKLYVKHMTMSNVFNHKEQSTEAVPMGTLTNKVSNNVPIVNVMVKIFTSTDKNAEWLEWINEWIHLSTHTGIT